ncbi:hypothetical protein R3P38DRAFT_2533313 [Favolaschia claudopus]|uniref:Zinc finger PHD-type domain-containing protein n=1 Tax=Favolaschia claudopus TaxID=2862362 RepID=A0AAW0BAJ9_9AGAR
MSETLGIYTDNPRKTPCPYPPNREWARIFHTQRRKQRKGRDREGFPPRRGCQEGTTILRSITFLLITHRPSAQQIVSCTVNLLLGFGILRTNKTDHKSEDVIERLPADVEAITSPSFFADFVPSLVPDSIPESRTSADSESPISLRREYVWRTIPNRRQSLGAVATQIESDLELKYLTHRKIARGDVYMYNAHRCTGYIREEVTLASSIADSAVVIHDAPSPLEVCPVCRQPVGFPETCPVRCICGDLDSGPRPMVQCRKCIFWSHVHCVGDSQEFVCFSC